METLKGKNFRVLTFDETGEKWIVLCMSTSCTVTLNTNQGDGTTKEDIGLATKPTVVSKSWQVNVSALNVSDAGALLTAIKESTKFLLTFDETDTNTNQVSQDAGFAQQGYAYISDITFTYNDRENSAKDVTFTGCGPLENHAEYESAELDPIAFTKGEKVRLFLSSDNTATPAAVIAAARQLSFHVSVTMESCTTKDTDGNWEVQEPTSIAFDISSTALIRGNDTITSLVGAQSLADIEGIYKASLPVKFQIANVSGDNQRTKGAVIVSGSVIVTQLTMNGPLGTADYTTQLTGYGAYTVGAAA